MIIFVEYSERYAQRNKRKLPYLDKPASAAQNIQCALQVVEPHLLTLRRALPFLQRKITTRRLIKLQCCNKIRIRTCGV